MLHYTGARATFTWASMKFNFDSAVRDKCPKISIANPFRRKRLRYRVTIGTVILICSGNDFNISSISIYDRMEGHFLNRKFPIWWFEARDRISFRTANTMCRLCVRKAYALTRFRSPHNPCIIAVDLDRPVPSKLFSIADYKMSIAIIELIYSLWESWRSDKLTGWENWKAFLTHYDRINN